MAAAAAAVSKDAPLSDRLNVIKANQDYINKMISEVTGMKVLLLDKETVSVTVLWVYLLF